MTENLLSIDGATLAARAADIRDRTHGDLVTYSRKVFIPLTELCRDVCHYCTFAKAPRQIAAPYLSLDQVRTIARHGAEAGCREALFTLGDKPELRYAAARRFLDEAGCASTVDYLERAARIVLEEHGLLPHLNPGILSRDELARLRGVSASMGIMLESTAERLCARGGPHFGSPDKVPAVRLKMIEEAGELAIPFTTGLLIGIGETRGERLQTIEAIADLHRRHGHIQEVIVQNFRAKPGTRMAASAEPSLEELVWTIAAARLMLPPDIAVQAPPNLSPGHLGALVAAGINDWGGVSPVTPDHVNPEAAWPQIGRLALETAESGKVLAERLTLYPAYARDPARWASATVARRIRELADASGLARDDRDWRAGISIEPPVLAQTGPAVLSAGLDGLLRRAMRSEPLALDDVETLLEARGGAVAEIAAAADEMRRRQAGDAVSYIVTRNINYTNICAYACRFCAFSKGRGARSLRGTPYDLDLEEVARRTREADARGAVEVCMQGGIHPSYDGSTYLKLLGAVKDAVPSMHVHAFSPLEVSHGAESLGLPLDTYLGRLRDAGLGSLPGTAAEVLDEEVRAILCPDKVSTREWIDVMRTAHRVGLRSTATIMFGHVDAYRHWARHLLIVRDLQRETGGFTEFVPLAFVAEQAPIYLSGHARPGPTWREALLMHAVARLTLGPWLPNIQASWVKMGVKGVERCLDAGANDIGGTLMNESITRAAGAAHGEEMTPARMTAVIEGLDRPARQRTTLYADVPAARVDRAFRAGDLIDIVQTPPRRKIPADRPTVPA